MYEFAYQRPGSLAEALTAIRENPGATLLAGGQTLIPVMKLRLAGPSRLVDLGGIAELTGIRRDGDRLLTGAMTCHADVAWSTLVRDTIPALARLAGAIGDPALRNRGTIGGAVANADPAADYAAALLGLGATVHTTERSVAADDFFTGLFETVLGEHEIITAVSFPIAERAGYARFPSPASRYPLVGVMVSRGPAGVRMAVTGARPSVFRLPDMEQVLTSDFSAAAIAGMPIAADGLNEDIHASAAYRGHLIGVMARAALDVAG